MNNWAPNENVMNEIRFGIATNRLACLVLPNNSAAGPLTTQEQAFGVRACTMPPVLTVACIIFGMKQDCKIALCQAGRQAGSRPL